MSDPKIPIPEKQPGFVRYILAANATGGGSAFVFLFTSIIAFGLGYYYHYSQVKNKNTEIVVQATNNDNLDKIVEKKQDKDDDYLNQSLAYIGYTIDDIKDLTKGKPDRLDRLKGKFTTIVKGETVYLPRDDCGDDYLGQDSADEANKIIHDGFTRRYKSND